MKSPSRFVGSATALVALTVFMASCTRGPDFVRPELPPQAGYGPAAGPLSGGKMAADWVTLFHSAALNDLVQAALSNNPDLESARHGLLAAQNELAAVKGTTLPQLSADAGVARAHINGSELLEPDQAFQATGNRFNMGPSLSYNLDLFGGIRRALEADTAAAADARDRAVNTYVTLVDQVVTTAFAEAAAGRQIEVTQSLVKEFQAQLDLTQKLENAGKITHSDALEAQAQLENIAATLPALEHQRVMYRNALARLLGKTPGEFTMPVLSLKDFTLPGDIPVSLPSDLVQQRPDIRIAEDLLHEASARIGVAEAARLPALGLSAQYAQQSTLLRQFLTQPAGVWSFGADIAGPLFDGGTLAARADEARENYAQAAAAYRGAVINAFVEVADALDALQRDGEGFAAHQRALKASGANRDLALAQYRAGKIDQLQVLVAEQQYQNAALSEIQADVQRFTDVAELFRSLGGGWWNAPIDPSLLPKVAATGSENTHE